MDNLSDDCHVRMLKTLHLLEQLKLFEETKTEATNRLRSNLRLTWQQNKSFFICRDQFDIFDRNPEVSREFFSTISPTVPNMEICYDNEENLKHMTMFKFSELRSLSLVRIHDCHVIDNVTPIVQLMSECSPNLENLGFYDSALNEKLLQLSLGLPKLRKLNLSFINIEIFDYVIQMRANDITKLNIHDRYFRDVKVIKKLKNLRHLTLGYCYMDKPVKLAKAIAALRSLERLDIVNYNRHNGFVEFVVDFVAKYPSLKILNVMYINTPLDKEFFERIWHPIKIGLNARSSPLSLHVKGIERDMDKHEILSYFRHSNIDVSFQHLEISTIDFKSVACHFDPINAE